MNGSPLETLLILLKILRTRKVAALVQEYVTALDALPDNQMRQTRLSEWLCPLPDEVALELLELLIQGAQSDRPRFRGVLNSVIDFAPMLHALGEERSNTWREVARREKLPSVLALLSVSPPKLRYYAPHQVDVNEYMESSPLGWRKTLARGRNRQALDRLLYDKHPGVIGILLDNPHIVERDVIKMAAMQPSTEQALKTIFAHPRWIRRYRVKKALIFNPYAPAGVALGLLGFMLEQDLLEASHSLRLSSEIRDRARSLLTVRRGRRHAVLTGVDTPAQTETLTTTDSTQERDPSDLELARQFLATLPDVETTLELLEDTRPEEDPLDDLADEFMKGLPQSLPLVPVGEEEEDLQ